MTDASLGFQSTSAMVGGSIGLSVGGGFALKHQKKANVAVALFGDGALDEGIAYEALNIASLYALPVLFLCENNSKEGEAQTSRLATKELTAVPTALKIPCASVDGGDPEAAAKAVEVALAHVRGGNGPYFLEAQLVRWPGSHQIVHEFTTGVTDVTAAWDDAKASNEHAEWQRSRPDPAHRAHAHRTWNSLARGRHRARQRGRRDHRQGARFRGGQPLPETRSRADGGVRLNTAFAVESCPALCRASTSFLQESKAWMAGTSPAMTPEYV